MDKQNCVIANRYSVKKAQNDGCEFVFASETCERDRYKRLFDAAAKGKTDKVVFLAKLININSVWSSQDDSEFGESHDFTPLWISARNGHTDTVRTLVQECKADPDTPDSENRTPVWAAARNGHTETVRALVKECNANCTAADINGFSPLYVAASEGHKDTVLTLLNEFKVKPRQTLQKAVELNNIGVINMLVKECGVYPAVVRGGGKNFLDQYPSSAGYKYLEELQKSPNRTVRHQVNFPPNMKCLNTCI